MVQIVEDTLVFDANEILECFDARWPLGPSDVRVNAVESRRLLEELRLEPPTTINCNQRATESDLDFERLCKAQARRSRLGLAALGVVRTKEERDIRAPSRCGTLFGGCIVLGVDRVFHIHLLPPTPSRAGLRWVKVDVIDGRR